MKSHAITLYQSFSQEKSDIGLPALPGLPPAKKLIALTKNFSPRFHYYYLNEAITCKALATQLTSQQRTNNQYQ
jgi:hypothetical protein